MRYVILFAGLGITLGVFAVNTGGWGYFLLWPALDCIMLTVGYCGTGHRVFGKSQDGRIPLWAWVVQLPFIVYSSAVWHVMRLLSRENAVDEVVDGVFLGRRLLNHETPPDIRNWVDLTSEFEDCRRQRVRHNYVCLPVLDGTVPSAQALASAVSRIDTGGHVHTLCAGPRPYWAVCLGTPRASWYHSQR